MLTFSANPNASLLWNRLPYETVVRAEHEAKEWNSYTYMQLIFQRGSLGKDFEKLIMQPKTKNTSKKISDLLKKYAYGCQTISEYSQVEREVPYTTESRNSDTISPHTVSENVLKIVTTLYDDIINVESFQSEFEELADMRDMLLDTEGVDIFRLIRVAADKNKEGTTYAIRALQKLKTVCTQYSMENLVRSILSTDNALDYIMQAL